MVVNKRDLQKCNLTKVAIIEDTIIFNCTIEGIIIPLVEIVINDTLYYRVLSSRKLSKLYYDINDNEVITSIYMKNVELLENYIYNLELNILNK